MASVRENNMSSNQVVATTKSDLWLEFSFRHLTLLKLQPIVLDILLHAIILALF